METLQKLKQAKAQSNKLFLTASILFAVIALAWMTWVGINAYKQNQTHVKTVLKIEHIRGEITYLDEVLTMSTAMYVMSKGQSRWRHRYRLYEPRFNQSLHAAINMIKPLASHIETQKLLKAEGELEKIEYDIMKLVDEKKFIEANTLLQSHNYRQQKLRYANGIAHLDKFLLKLREQQISAEKSIAIKSMIFHLMVIVILSLAWIVLYRREQDIGNAKHKYLEKLANYDFLTKLPNRAMFEFTIAQTVARARRYDRTMALLYVDLDNFKKINDTLGHALGDQVLQNIAKRLQENTRAGDTVARIGGDEFAIVLDEISSSQAAALVANKIIKNLAPPHNLSNNTIYVTASIGIACFPLSGENVETLTKNADAAMYRAKNTGKNNYQFYTADINQLTTRNLKLESALHSALERNEFTLHYQPKVDLKSGQIIGVEALLRWEHPHLGMIPPTEFIPIAENTGLICPIGEWVMRIASLQMKRWQDKGLADDKMKVSVNLSIKQLNQDNLIDAIKNTLVLSKIEPHCLELELTEGAVMADPQTSIGMLKQIHDLGTGISIDDFGTGYSSLSYLKLLPIDVLKIDKSFVRDIETDPNDTMIVKAIIKLGKSLGLTVIAEGVEDIAQLNFLKNNGCDQMQGYYFSKPLPPEDLEKLLTDKTTL